ncbi:HK97 gp10 family phage protein [Fictibacillus sp. 23RED33]|uniref:HK97 gp10 family phage protein n=1 Tax=Fictibacillus sp. 23RED33 TaxID=2745879 RepID=UPI0018CE536F|nr:HK97 gp10 family phage protein [Fictibacillus sp. 23RED33]
MVKIADLEKEIARQIKLYTTSVEEDLVEAKDEVSRDGVSLLKQNSPEDTGDYRKGWTRKKIGQDFVIHNKTDYQLTHLLEYGHVKAGGGRVSPKVHIRPVEERLVDEYVKRVEKAIKP